MYFNDHEPAHFHAKYGDCEGRVEIVTLKLLDGSLPRRVLSLVLEWAHAHRDELLADWDLCRQGKPPKMITPLD
jgi:hypothetical protein